MLAIDVGSTRIKAAYLATGAREPGFVCFDGKPWLASQAHVPADGNRVVFGDAAQRRAEVDAAGTIDGDVLAQVALFGSVRIGRRTVPAHELLGSLLTFVRAQAAACKAPPEALEDLVVAMPWGGDGAAEANLRAAAQSAGFDDARVMFAPEAAAAATGGLPPGSSLPANLIWVDVGGRTARLAWLRGEDGRLALQTEVRPRLLAEAGAASADLAVLEQLLDEAEDDSPLHPGEHATALRQLAAARELLGNSDEPLALRLPSRTLTFESALVRRAIARCVTEPLRASVEQFLKDIALCGVGEPEILLTGGANGAPGLREAMSEFGCSVVAARSGDEAVVRGALLASMPVAPSSPVEPPPPVTGGNRSRAQDIGLRRLAGGTGTTR